MWQPGTEPDSEQAWVSSVASLPVAFAQVREDPWVDRELVDAFGRPPRVLMIASGGETAALLASRSVSSIDLVDANRSQLELTRLKLRLLQESAPDERRAILGYVRMSSELRGNRLRQLADTLEVSPDIWGPVGWVSEIGPDQCGRYEWLFARMRDLLHDVREPLAQALSLREVAEQQTRFAKGTELGDAVERALRSVMALEILVQIFGSEATANRVQNFADHFLGQTRWALATMPAGDNPFLHQMFLGKFLSDEWPWLELPCVPLPPIRTIHAMMLDALIAAKDQSYDFIHLSNTLDWVSPAEAARVLGEACRCLAPGGRVVIRQLNSKLDIRAADSGLGWDDQLSRRLHATDRSFFYRALHVGAKR